MKKTVLLMAQNPGVMATTSRGHMGGIACIKNSNATPQKALSAQMFELTRQRPARDVPELARFVNLGPLTSAQK